MGGKHSKCCCCPNCTYRVELCCPCVCPAICVTFTPSDYDCEPESVELDWEDAISGYRGTLAGHDLYYYIERDPPPPGKERGPCKFKLRSESLGYPEGYEYEWEIPCDPYDEEVPCTTCLALETELGVPADAYRECSGGTLTTRCVEWIMPRLCDNCVCLCECICVFVTKDGIAYSGKACWSEYEQAYEGDVEGLDAYGQAVSLGVSVPIARWGDVCDPDTDYDCDPYSDDCAIRLEIIDGEDRFESAWQKMAEPCQLRAVTYSFHIERDPYNDADDIEASVRCATCNEDCEPANNAECQCDDGVTQRRLPKDLTLTLTNKLFCSRLDGSYPMTYHTDPEPPTPGSSFIEFWDSPVFQCNFDTGFFLRLSCSEAGVQGFTLQAVVAPGATLHTMYFANECNGAFTQDQTNDSAWACAASTCEPLRLVFPDLLEEGVSGGYANNCCQEDHEGDDREPRLAVEITE